MNLLNRSKMFYLAQGFVEALIAILISGIASILFMTIAARTIADVVHNEKVDMLTQEAVKGSIIATNIVEEWNFGNRTLINSDFLDPESGFESSIGKCYGLDGDVDKPIVTTMYVCPFYSDTQIGINPSLCASDSNWGDVAIDVKQGEVEDMFRIVCVDSTSNKENMVLALRVYTGFRSCNTINSVVREVSDVDISCDLYEYITVLKLEPIVQ